MQWTGEPGAGFTPREVTPWLRFGDLTCNVEDQRDDPASFLTLCRDLIALRAATPDLATGAWTRLEAPDDVLGYRRGDATVVALNLGDGPVVLDGITGTVVVATDRSRDGEMVDAGLTIAPHTGVVLVRP